MNQKTYTTIQSRLDPPPKESNPKEYYTYEYTSRGQDFLFHQDPCANYNISYLMTYLTICIQFLATHGQQKYHSRCLTLPNLAKKSTPQCSLQRHQLDYPSSLIQPLRP
jgi:hypothetical protein